MELMITAYKDGGTPVTFLKELNTRHASSVMAFACLVETLMDRTVFDYERVVIFRPEPRRKSTSDGG